MKILNNNIILANDIILCKSTPSKMKGLMFHKKLKNNQCLVLKNNKDSLYLSTIHTFFVFFPLDVIWLDSKNKVVDIKKNIPPFSSTIYPKKPASMILEFRAGTIKNQVKTNDRLKINF